MDNKKPWRKIVKDKNYSDTIQRDNMNQLESLFGSMLGKIDLMIETLQGQDKKTNGKSN